MNVGDLVLFTHPHARDVGIILSIERVSNRREPIASVMWSVEQFTEAVSIENEHLKLVQDIQEKHRNNYV